MMNENKYKEVADIKRSLKFIQRELDKTIELKRLLWEFMHEDPVIALNLINNYTKSTNTQSVFMSDFIDNKEIA